MVAILRSTITVVVAIHMNTATGGKQEGEVDNNRLTQSDDNNDES